MTTGTNPLEAIATAVHAAVRKGMELIFPRAIDTTIVGKITWADVATAGCLGLFFLALHALLAGTFRHKKRMAAQRADGTHHCRIAAWNAVSHPLYVLIWVVALYLAVAPLLFKLPSGGPAETARAVCSKLFDAAVFFIVLWLCVRLTRVIDVALGQWAAGTKNLADELLVPLIGRGVRAMVPVVGVLLALPVLGLPAAYHNLIATITSLLIIGAIAWFLFQSVSSGRALVLSRFDISAADNLRARTVHTQVRVITRTLYVAIGVLAFGAALMEFNEVRHIGASLLASAGILGVIGGLAAQSTLSNLFAGFQLALAQPIRLDDVVVVEGAWGRIEEITLTYVVIHVWDDTRLVAPLNYFITKPFQNWTRSSAKILGQVHFWADYSLPVNDLRPAIERIVKACPLWDGRFWNLQVVEASQRSMQLRILATASDSSRAWDLRCKIREEVLAYIQKTYPGSLPRIRAEVDAAADGAPALPALLERKKPAAT